MTFFKRGEEQCGDKIAQFYLTIKVHKTPYKFRPIVATCGTLLSLVSRWLDYKLQQCIHLVPTYLKNSKDLINQLRELGDLPRNAKLFSYDAISMYTNIDTEHAILCLNNWLHRHELEIPRDFPIEAVVEAAKLVMRNNFFQFGDRYYKQIRGTAMGTNAAVPWAIIYYAAHEEALLIPKYMNNLSKLLFCKRFIDDGLGVWLGDGDTEDCATFNAFKHDLDQHGVLRWEATKPTHKLDFLDVTIEIINGKIVTRTFQKAMNLYLYIPQHSAHPPGMIKGVIFGLLQTYHWQNTLRTDFLKQTRDLFDRLVARGWDPETLKTMFNQAVSRIDHPSPRTQPSNTKLSNKQLLFFHMQFHPFDIPRRKVRQIYQEVCGEYFRDHLDSRRQIIAYFRPENIRDITTSSKLYQAPGREVSTFEN